MELHFPAYGEVDGEACDPSDEQAAFHAAAAEHTYVFFCGGL